MNKEIGLRLLRRNLAEPHKFEWAGPSFALRASPKRQLLQLILCQPVVRLLAQHATPVAFAAIVVATPAMAGPYPFTKELDCGTITISLDGEHIIVFDFKTKKTEKCTCKEFGWIQHVSNADVDSYRYDNGVLTSGSQRQGAKSDPSKKNQPTTPPSGTKPEDWDDNPWYGGTTDKTKPKDFDAHPTPQIHISDKPDHPLTKFKTQLVCVAGGEVFLTWEWGPLTKGNESLDKVGGKSVAPP
jgi:hypothetical protein